MHGLNIVDIQFIQAYHQRGSSRASG